MDGATLTLRMSDDTWTIAPVDLRAARRLAAEVGVSPLVGEILLRRGYGEAEAACAFLHPDYLVHSPYALAGVAEARVRIDRALARGERIAVHGDYDADGITATFLLVEVLRGLGAEVVWHLPNRFDEGYGVSREAIDELVEQGARLLVTVDCGVRARDEIDYARGLGLDVLVTDHHVPLGDVPDCVVIDPRLDDGPCADLAGVGVALKLAHALLEDRAADMVEIPLALRPYLDVVAVGTVADVVPLRGENRSLVAMGIGRLRAAPRPGLAALMEVAGVEPAEVDSTAIGYRLAPRLNAAGRLEDARLALGLLHAPDRSAALPLAQQLGQLNAVRQEIEATMLREALALVPDPPPAAVVLSSPAWHEGVVGIVASRVVEKINRPAILLSVGDEMAKGSGRSIPAFDLLAAVTACDRHLLGYGGHRAACGLRLRPEHIGAFGDDLVAEAAARLSPADLRRLATVDAVVCGDDLTLTLADELELFAPHGHGNPRVQLLLHGAQIRSPRVTRDRRHTQCDVSLDGVTRGAVRFGFDAPDTLRPEVRYDVPAVLARNSFNGMVRAQLQVRGSYEVPTVCDDLCPTPCDLSCPDRLRGGDLWAALRDPVSVGEGDGDGAAALAAEMAREGRLVDQRRRPVASTLTALVAAGGRLLVLVADVARRRPLLTRDIYLPDLGHTYLYLNGACVAARLPLALEGDAVAGEPPNVVMASTVTAAAHPELVAACDRVALVDPPFDEAAWACILQSAAPTADIHCVWGESEVEFARRVWRGAYAVDAVCRRVYRAVEGCAGRSTDLEGELLGRKGFLAKLPTLAAAWQTLVEAGLLADEGGMKKARSDVGTIDLRTSATYRLWHERHNDARLLDRCLTTSI